MSLATNVELTIADVDREIDEGLPQTGDGQLDLLIDGSLEESSSIGWTESLLNEPGQRCFTDLKTTTLILNLSLVSLQIKNRYLPDLIKSKRRENDDFIDPIPKLR